jgi:hypothetical protein
LERRQGKRISAKGIYRDPVRSSHGHFVKSSALRWVCVTLLAEVPWARRVWSLPFLSTLAPSERYAKEAGKRHKKLTEWAWQLLLQVRRWQPASVRSWPSRTAPTPPSNCSTAVEGSPTRSPSSPVFGWTPLCTNRLRRDALVS